MRAGMDYRGHHHPTHEDGGNDKLTVAGLVGLLAEDQHVLDVEVLAVAAALLHAARHIPGGADPMRWTNAKLLLGAGAGADPTEVDLPTGGLGVAETMARVVVALGPEII